jgi:hypothetical protein
MTSRSQPPLMTSTLSIGNERAGVNWSSPLSVEHFEGKGKCAEQRIPNKTDSPDRKNLWGFSYRILGTRRHYRLQVIRSVRQINLMETRNI